MASLTLSPSTVTTVDRAIFDFFIKEAETDLIVEAPWLANPFLKAVLDFLIKTYGDKLFALLNNYVVFSAIDFNQGQEQGDYDKALAALIAAQEDPNADQDKASQEFDDAFSRLIHFDT